MVAEEWDIDSHLAGKTPEVVVLYDRFIALAESCGPFTYAVSRSAITLKGERRGFAGAVLKSHHLGGYLDLQRRIEGDPRIDRSSAYGSRLYVHHFRIRTLGDLDDMFAHWLDEAYAVGAGAHLTSPRRR